LEKTCLSHLLLGGFAAAGLAKLNFIPLAPAQTAILGEALITPPIVLRSDRKIVRLPDAKE
jgi:hypothetical protein